MKKLYAGCYITKCGHQVRRHCDTGMWVVWHNEDDGGGPWMSFKTLSEVRKIFS